jgi:2-dehydropantoate 2-reductase
MAEEKSKFKIAVVGIGGVGGFIGGKLAARFADSEEAEIVLAARGANEKAIRERGLKLIATNGEQIVQPGLAAVTEIGEPDLLILCTKEYDLEETAAALKNSIGKQTVILPLLNGVDTKERIARVLPGAEIWQGCIYIISRLVSPGVVEESGNICLIYFGNGKGESEKARRVETLFREAGIDAHFTEDIEARIWEKFVFISALAAATSYLNARIGEVINNPQNKKLLDALVTEIKQVARAKNINISEDAIQQKIDNLDKVPADATSSMHTDFSRGHRAELRSLVGYVVGQARALNVPAPVYDKVYGELAEKLKQAATK